MGELPFALAPEAALGAWLREAEREMEPHRTAGTYRGFDGTVSLKQHRFVNRGFLNGPLCPVKRLIDKGAIVREDPGFICKANITKKKIQETETNILLDKFYGGSLVNFINSYMMNYRMNEEERDALLQLAQRKQS